MTAEEESEANEEADYYLENSSEKMLSKVNISKERLVEIYKKEKIAKKDLEETLIDDYYVLDSVARYWDGELVAAHHQHKHNPDEKDPVHTVIFKNIAA